MFENFFKEMIKKEEENQKKEMTTLGLTEEEYKNLLLRRKQESDKKLEEIVRKQKEEEQKERLRILTEIHPNEIELKCTKTNLNKIIKWGSSRFNDYKKQDVVNFVFATVNGSKKNNGSTYYEDYTCGSYSERSDCSRSGHYRVISYKGEVRLIVNPNDKEKIVYKLV